MTQMSVHSYMEGYIVKRGEPSNQQTKKSMWRARC